MTQLDNAPGLVEHQAVLERHLRHRQLELGKLRGKARDALLQELHRQTGAYKLRAAVGVADDLGRAQEKVAADVINMVMRVDQPCHWLGRHLLHGREKTAGHRWHHEGVHSHSSGLINQEPGVAHPELTVRLDVGVDLRGHFFDASLPPFGGDKIVHRSPSAGGG